jgi:hypothetical protein
MTDVVLPVRDAALLADALGSALTSASGIASRPGQLRSALVAALDAQDAVRLRGWVHQLVVGSEEHLPARLTELAPLTPQSVDRLAAELAAARGWSPASATMVSQLWASALGLGGGIDRSGTAQHPSFPADPPEAAGPASQESAPQHPSFPAAAATVLPAEPSWPQPARPEPAWEEPVWAEPASPPSAWAEPASPPSAWAQPASPEPAWVESASSPSAWPQPHKRVAALARPADGSRPLAVGQAYGGMDVIAFTVAIVGVIVAVIVALIAFFPSGAQGARAVVGVPAVAAAAFLRQRLRAGLLIATATGLQFTEFDARMRQPKPGTTVVVAWPDVTVEVGTVSRVRLGTRGIQLGPRNRALAEAVARRVSGSPTAQPAGPQ